MLIVAIIDLNFSDIAGYDSGLRGRCTIVANL